MKNESGVFSWTVMLGGLLLAIALCVIGVIVLLVIKPLPKPPAQQPTAILLVSTLLPNTATPDSASELLMTPTAMPTNGKFKSGDFVQVVNTAGEGLQIRSGAGVDNPPNFLAMDAEVFEVKDGPVKRDGYIWWYLNAPYDANRAGWAAENFLDLVIK